MDKSYYIEYYDLERKHWWFRVRERILMDRAMRFMGQSHTAGMAPIKILNVGVATGRSSEALAALGHVTSIEYDEVCCDFTRAKTGLEIIQGSILDLPFEDDSFDLVCSFDVVEHVENDRLAVSELKRVCKKGGVIFISVPALMALWSHHDEVNQHFKRYKINEIDALFLGTKEKIITRTYFNSLLFPPIFLLRILSKVFPGLFSRNESGSDFTLLNQDSLVNKISNVIFSIERKLLNYINFPIGVSIMYAIRK